MKRIILVIALIVAAFFIFSPQSLFVPRSVPADINATMAPSVSVILDTGTTIATISGVTAQTAYQALIEATKKQNLELKTTQYDFGVFVEQIGSLVNTKEKTWIYFVNGKAGTVAADKQSVNTGDVVEWKYMTPVAE